MHAGIISIGDELLIGQVVNTNAAYIAEKLNSIGIAVDRIIIVGDNEEELFRAIEEYVRTCDVTIATGGLGPTHDDVTKAVLCRYFNTSLVLDPMTLENIKMFMQRRTLPWTKAADEQALVPKGCTVIPNKHGTAPGMMFERNDKLLVALPGVPYEMVSMVDEFLVPFFEKKIVGHIIRHRTLKTTGIPESFLAQQLGNLDEILQGAKLAFLPTPLGVRLRITVVETNSTEAEKRLHEVEQRIRAKADKYIYGINDEELEHVVGRLLMEQKLTIAIAESCTGGLIADRITNVPGSSAYFERAVVVYSNRSKVELLGVAEEALQKFGAVSKEIAEAMAIGIRSSAKTDIGLSTTGIAGPAGGTPDKPVGLLWIGYADAAGSFGLKFSFGDDRLRFKERASQAALELLRRKLLKKELNDQRPT